MNNKPRKDFKDKKTSNYKDERFKQNSKNNKKEDRNNSFSTKSRNNQFKNQPRNNNFNSKNNKSEFNEDVCNVDLLRQIKDLDKEPKIQVKPVCPIYKQCGGCQIQHIDYQAQLDFKKKYVEGLMKGIGKVNDTIGMKHPFRYRNKIQVTMSTNKNRQVVAGFYQESTHQVIPMDTCYIQDEFADQIINTIKTIMNKQKINPYNEDKKTGLIRHILIKRGFHTNETMVVLVTSSDVFPGRNNFVQALRTAHPEITTIIQNTNPRSTSIVLGDKERVLFGKGFIEDVLCGLRFKISAKSFYQVNPVQTEILYNKAIEFADLKGNETVLDAYCGIGTIGLIASKKAKEVIGVEINKDAVKDALENSKVNKVTNAKFFNAPAEDFMVNLANTNQKMDVVMIDPPRKGCDIKFLDSLLKLMPNKIVYISCDPSTQARDLNYLIPRGYKVEEIQPVDMFPHTHHVETVVLLTKK